MNLALSIIVTLLLLPWPGMIMMSPMMVASKDFGASRSAIFMALLIINYPVLFFLLLKLPGRRFFGTDPLWWALGILLVSGGVTVAYGLPRMLTNTFAGSPNEGRFATERNVYYHGRKIPGPGLCERNGDSGQRRGELRVSRPEIRTRPGHYPRADPTARCRRGPGIASTIMPIIRAA